MTKVGHVAVQVVGGFRVGASSFLLFYFVRVCVNFSAGSLAGAEEELGRESEGNIAKEKKRTITWRWVLELVEGERDREYAFGSST